MHATFTYRPLRHVSTPRLRGADGSLRHDPRQFAGYAEIVLCWDEQNRLQGARDKSSLSVYQYDANGERTYKLTGDYTYQNISGTWRYFYQMDNATLYASSYLVVTPRGYTKHYYAESERIASKLGNGGLQELGHPLADEFHVHEKFIANTSHARNVIYECLNAGEVRAYPPLSYLYELTSASQSPENERYFYHPDHLGSSSWITFTDGEAVQHLHYLPFGEDFVNQQHTVVGAMYTFSAKEKDAETGYSYFGSRYYNSDLSIWLSVDPMSDKYPSMSPYIYCANNPVKLVDPNGEEIWIPGVDENNNIVVDKEFGDDFESFKRFMGPAYSDDELRNMYGQMSQNGRINLTKTYGKEFQIMTDALNDAYSDPDFEKSKNYNCWGAALAVVNRVKLQGNGPDDYYGISYNYRNLEQFDNSLSGGYVQVSSDAASVGKTVLRFGKNDGDNPHGAIYMGKDRNGTEYVFTKNGWEKRPEITQTKRMQFENGYGGNCDRSGRAGQGYYNHKNRRRR